LKKEIENGEINPRIQSTSLIEVVLKIMSRKDIKIKIEMSFQIKLVKFLVISIKEGNPNIF
jgi:hypothetical protein